MTQPLPDVNFVRDVELPPGAPTCSSTPLFGYDLGGELFAVATPCNQEHGAVAARTELAHDAVLPVEGVLGRGGFGGAIFLDFVSSPGETVRFKVVGYSFQHVV